MKSEKIEKSEKLYTLIPIEDFKTLAGIDDRDDKTARFCLTTATLEIENYCQRNFRNKKYFETINLYGELCLPLNEYPVLSLNSEQVTVNSGAILDPKYYRVIPDCGTIIDIPFLIEFSPAVLRMGVKAVKVVYFAGYKENKIPADLSAACMELAVWKFNRFKGRRVGFTGNVKNDGGKLETTMPENIKASLEPYRRKTI